MARSHAFKAGNRFDMLRCIDRGFLEEQVSRICGGAMARFFPAIRGLADAL
jgi:hypothetical protein